jgi:hypothetical protein
MKSSLSAILCILLPCVALAEKEDQSKLSYDSGMIYAVAGEAARARAAFEKASQIQGDYADLARLELLRIQAKDGKTQLSVLLTLLSSIKDQQLSERAHMHLSGSLLESRRPLDALDVALLFSGKFPESELADNAVLLSAKILFELGKNEAARVQAVTILTKYPKSDSVDAARQILARLSLTPDENYNPALACGQWERIAGPGSEIQTAIEPAFTAICP